MVDNNSINETETALKSIPKEFLDSLKKDN